MEPIVSDQPIRRADMGRGVDLGAEIARSAALSRDDLEQLGIARVPVPAEVARRSLAALVRIEALLTKQNELLAALGERLTAPSGNGAFHPSQANGPRK